MDVAALTAAGLHQADPARMVGHHTAVELTVDPRLLIMAHAAQLTLLAPMVVRRRLMVVGLRVTEVDLMAVPRLRTVAEEPHRMAEAEPCPRTVGVGGTPADSAADIRLLAVVAATVAAGIDKSSSNANQRRLRAALVFAIVIALKIFTNSRWDTAGEVAGWKIKAAGTAAIPGLYKIFSVGTEGDVSQMWSITSGSVNFVS